LRAGWLAALVVFAVKGAPAYLALMRGPELCITFTTGESHSLTAARATLHVDSPLQSDGHQALAQLKRTLVSINSLADHPERHPESIVWGKAR
jgi:hypothetical protein